MRNRAWWTKRIILYVLGKYGFPPLPSWKVEEDRTWFWVNGMDVFACMTSLVPKEFTVWNWNRNHGPTAVCGWRENKAMYALQLVLHKGGILEADIDRFNPDQGLGPMLLHGLMCLFTPNHADPKKAWKALRKRWKEEE